jgi:all-trans-retinol dehydrogenase (NAD+)
MKDLQAKTVVITGAAGDLGKELVKAALKSGARCALMDINKKSLDEFVASIGASGKNVCAYFCDITSAKSIQEVGAAILNDFGRVDVLINNAGLLKGRPFHELNFEDISSVINVNLIGMMWVTRQFIRHMMENKTGSVVNVVSVAGLVALPGESDYSASKHGGIGFNDALRREMKKQGYKDIDIICVCPSYIRGKMTDGLTVPFSSPLIEPDFVAKNIIQAVIKRKAFVVLPKSLQSALWLKFLSPRMADKILELMGFFKSRDTYIKYC